MKHLKYLIILFLLITTPVYAGGLAAIVGGRGAAAAFVNYCTDATHDKGGATVLLCEDFQHTNECATGYESTCWTVADGWAVQVTGGDSLTFGGSPAGTYCTGTTNSKVLTITAAGAGSATNALFNYGSSVPVTYSQFYLNVSADTNTAWTRLFVAGYNTSIVSYDVRLVNVSGTFYLQLVYYNGLANITLPASNSANNQISVGTNTWYLVKVKFDETAQTVEFIINSTSVATATDNASVRTMQYYGFGDYGNLGYGKVTFSIDNFAVKTSGYPDACN